MKQPKTIAERVLEYAKDVFDVFLRIIKFILSGGISSGFDSSSDYWERERQRDRSGYYKDH